MNTYVVRVDSPKPKLMQRVIETLLFSGTFFVLTFVWKFFWPTVAQRNQGLLRTAIETGVVSILWGLGMTFWPKRIPSYKLLINEESIIGVTEYSGWMKWLVTKKTISKGKVRSAWSIRGRLGMPSGMGFSERSILRARLFGFVYLPNTLPEYEYLRTLAESWRSHEEII